MGGVCSPEMRKRLTDEGRFQTDIDGNPVPGFLCPNHPANHRLKVESMAELAKCKPVVRTLHFPLVCVVPEDRVKDVTVRIGCGKH